MAGMHGSGVLPGLPAPVPVTLGVWPDPCLSLLPSGQSFLPCPGWLQFLHKWRYLQSELASLHVPALNLLQISGLPPSRERLSGFVDFLPKVLSAEDSTPSGMTMAEYKRLNL